MGVQAVALSEPVLQAAAQGGTNGPVRFVLGFESCQARSTAGGILDAGAFSGRLHLGVEIREQVKRSRSPDRQPASSVETKEEDAGLALEGYIGSAVHLGKFMNQRQATGLHAQIERRDGKPCFSVKAVEFERCRYQWAQRFGGNWPMCEQKIVPALHHNPGFSRELPRPVVPDAQNFSRRLH